MKNHVVVILEEQDFIDDPKPFEFDANIDGESITIEVRLNAEKDGE